MLSAIIKFLVVIIILIILSLVIINGTIYYFQDNLIYKKAEINPKYLDATPVNYETVDFLTAEGYIYKCWFVKTDNSEEKPSILYLLGNGGYMEAFTKTYNTLVKELDANILGCSNRGSGTYEGKPSEQNFYSDSEMFLNYLLKRSKFVFLHGRSMGGAVAIELAYRNSKLLTGLIVENTFLNIEEMAKIKYYLLSIFLFTYKIIHTRMDNLKKIKSITIPTFFTVSLNDKIIPHSHTETLYNESASKYKVLFKSLYGTHDNVKRGQEAEYYGKYKEFILKSIELFKADNNLN